MRASAELWKPKQRKRIKFVCFCSFVSFFFRRCWSTIFLSFFTFSFDYFKRSIRRDSFGACVRERAPNKHSFIAHRCMNVPMFWPIAFHLIRFIFYLFSFLRLFRSFLGLLCLDLARGARCSSAFRFNPKTGFRSCPSCSLFSLFALVQSIQMLSLHISIRLQRSNWIWTSIWWRSQQM